MIILGLVVTTGWGASRGGLSIGGYLLVELLADAAGGVVLLVASVTVMRHRRQRRVPLEIVVTVWFVIGLARGLVLSRFYLEDAAQVVSATITLTAWALLIIYLAATFSEERERAVRLQTANAELRVIRDSMQDVLDEERGRLADAVRDAVSPEITRLRALVTRLDRPGSTAEITALADTVAAYSTNVVRKTSHELREENPLPVTRPSGRGDTLPPPGVLESYARASQPVIIPMGLITVRAISVWVSQDDAAALAGLIGLVVVTGAALLCRSALDRLLPRPSWREMVASTALIALVAAALAGVFPWVRGGVSGPAYVPPAMIFAFVLVVLVAARLVAGLERRATRQAREMARINADLEQANRELRDEVHVVRDQLADLLHGPVQGRLAAASMALRMYVATRESGGEADLSTTVRMATTLLDRAQSDIERIGRLDLAGEESLADGIDRIRRTWGGLLDIDVVQDDRWARPPEVLSGCADVVTELVTNASRHGDARRVSVSISGLDSERILIEAVDDGSGPSTDVREGQGLASVKRWNGTWKMAPGESGGTRVSVILSHDSTDDVSAPESATRSQADAPGFRSRAAMTGAERHTP